MLCENFFPISAERGFGRFHRVRSILRDKNILHFQETFLATMPRSRNTKSTTYKSHLTPQPANHVFTGLHNNQPAPFEPGNETVDYVSLKNVNSTGLTENVWARARGTPSSGPSSEATEDAHGGITGGLFDCGESVDSKSSGYDHDDSASSLADKSELAVSLDDEVEACGHKDPPRRRKRTSRKAELTVRLETEIVDDEW